MIISKIKQIAKTNRYHLYADEVWQGVFLDEILAVYKLKTNQETAKIGPGNNGV